MKRQNHIKEDIPASSAFEFPMTFTKMRQNPSMALLLPIP